MPNEDAQFNEVLEISIDRSAFAESLAGIKAEWDKFVATFGDQAAGVVGAGMFSSLKEEVIALKAQLKDVTVGVGLFAEEAVTAADHSTQAIINLTQKVEAVREETSAANRARIEADTQVEIDGLNKVFATQKLLASDATSLPQSTGRDKVESRFQDDRTTALDDAVAAKEQANLKIIAADEKLAAKELAITRDIAIEQ